MTPFPYKYTFGGDQDEFALVLIESVFAYDLWDVPYSYFAGWRLPDGRYHCCVWGRAQSLVESQC